MALVEREFCLRILAPFLSFPPLSKGKERWVLNALSIAPRIVWSTVPAIADAVAVAITVRSVRNTITVAVVVTIAAAMITLIERMDRAARQNSTYDEQRRDNC